MAADYRFFLADRAAVGAAMALGAAAIAVWTAGTARPEAAPDEPVAAGPKLAGGAERAGVAAVAAAAVVAAVVTPLLDQMPFVWLGVLGLALAAAMRGYRLTRPGSPAFDRWTAALAIVPACALLVAAVFMALEGSGGTSALVWLGGYLIAGAVALGAGVRWRRTAGA